MRQELFPLDDLRPGAHRRVSVGGQEIVVIRTTDGDIYALRDLCPHRGARLSHGHVGRIMGAAAIGEYKLESRFALRCPWHGYEFELESGRCPADQRRRVRTYKVAVWDGVVVIDG